MTATEPLDPAAIMAEHRRPNLGSWCIVCWDGEDDRSGDWPCLPYRLAAALAVATENVKRLRFSKQIRDEHEEDLTRQRDELEADLAKAKHKLAAVESALLQGGQSADVRWRAAVAALGGDHASRCHCD